MIVKTVKFPGFDGENIEEQIYLHLTKAEFMKLDMKYDEYGGIINYMRKLLTDASNTKNDGNNASVMKPLLTFLDVLLLAAYGRKTEDGKFVKKMYGRPLSEEFESSEAYSQLLIDLLSSQDEKELENLIMGILPVSEIDMKAVNEKKAQITSIIGKQ